MCLAILKPAKAVIPEEHLRQGFKANGDGAGFAFVRGGKVVIEKGFMKFDDFLAAYKKAYSHNKKSPFLIHFRIGTSGARDDTMTHPFPLSGGALIHNGGISGTTATWGTGKSDTCLFAEKFKDVLTFDTITKNQSKFDDALGHNKLCMLYDDGKYCIINEKSGVWVNDVWYSNSSFRSYANNNYRPTGYASTPGYLPAPSNRQLTTSPGAATTAPVGSVSAASEAYYDKHFGPNMSLSQGE